MDLLPPPIHRPAIIGDVVRPVVGYTNTEPDIDDGLL
jgi:hypothetical protein